jgi:hypothetical protein
MIRKLLQDSVRRFETLLVPLELVLRLQVFSITTTLQRR